MTELSYHRATKDSDDEDQDSDQEGADTSLPRDFQDEDIDDSEAERGSDDDLDGESLFMDKATRNKLNFEGRDGDDYGDLSDLLEDAPAPKKKKPVAAAAVPFNASKTKESLFSFDESAFDSEEEEEQDQDEDEDEDEEDEEDEEEEEDTSNDAHDQLVSLINNLDKNPIKGAKLPDLTEQFQNESVHGLQASLSAELLAAMPDEFSALKTELEGFTESGALPLPVSTFEANKLQRKVTMQQAKSLLSKWVPFVKAQKEKAGVVYEHRVKLDNSISLIAAAQSASELDNEIGRVLEEGGRLADDDAPVNPEEERRRLREIIKLRTIMFYQEIKNKRQKKIKSKKYRKILKKQREKESAKQEEALAKIDPDYAKRQAAAAEETRIRERMTLRHKNNSKFMKSALRGGLNTEIRQDLNEQKELARDLMSRMKQVDSEEEESESEDEAPTVTREDVESIDKSMPTKDRLKMKLQLLGMDSDVPDKGIGSMKFMQTSLERSLDKKIKGAMDDYDEMEEEERERAEQSENRISTHKPIANKSKSNKTMASGDLLEQAGFSAGHKMKMSASLSVGDDVTEESVEKGDDTNAIKKKTKKQAAAAAVIEADAENPWLNISNKGDKKATKEKKKESKESTTTATTTTTTEPGTKKKKNNFGMSLITSTKQKKLLLEAFAEDQVEEEFVQQKREIIQEDLPAEAPKALPGWGSWAGEGIKVKQVDQTLIKKQRQEKMKVAAQKRIDAKNSRVIIDEVASTNSVGKYLLSKTPAHFKTTEQYESTLATPLGKDWNTRSAYEKLIEPKVTVIAGTYIKPVSKQDREDFVANEKDSKQKKTQNKTLKSANNTKVKGGNKQQQKSPSKAKSPAVKK
eukprot:gene3716-4283_t